MTLAVFGVRHGRSTCTPDRGATGSVSKHHSVANELSYQFSIRSFTAACACTGEFQQGLFKLNTFNGIFVHGVSFGSNFVHCIIPVSSFFHLGCQRFHYQSFAFGCGADLCAVTATGAIQRGNVNSKFQTFCADSIFRRQGSRSFSSFFFSHKNGTDSCVGANERALVTLDTSINLPFGNVDCDTAFFISAGATGESTVGIFIECAYGQFVAFQTVHGNEKFIYKFVTGFSSKFAIFCISPSSRNFYSNDSVNALVDGSVVHINNVLTFFAVGMFNSFFQMLNRGFQRNNISQFEERRLHNHIDTTAKTDFLSNLNSINDVEFNIVFCDVTFQLTREVSIQFFCSPGAV